MWNILRLKWAAENMGVHEYLDKCKEDKLQTSVNLVWRKSWGSMNDGWELNCIVGFTMHEEVAKGLRVVKVRKGMKDAKWI